MCKRDDGRKHAEGDLNYYRDGRKNPKSYLGQLLLEPVLQRAVLRVAGDTNMVWGFIGFKGLGIRAEALS